MENPASAQLELSCAELVVTYLYSSALKGLSRTHYNSITGFNKPYEHKASEQLCLELTLDKKQSVLAKIQLIFIEGGRAAKHTSRHRLCGVGFQLFF